MEISEKFKSDLVQALGLVKALEGLDAAEAVPGEADDSTGCIASIALGHEDVLGVRPVIKLLKGAIDGTMVCRMSPIFMAGNRMAVSNSVPFALNSLYKFDDESDRDLKDAFMAQMLTRQYLGSTHTEHDLVRDVLSGLVSTWRGIYMTTDRIDGEMLLDTVIACDYESIPDQLDYAVGYLLHVAALATAMVRALRDSALPGDIAQKTAVVALKQTVRDAIFSPTSNEGDKVPDDADDLPDMVL